MQAIFDRDLGLPAVVSIPDLIQWLHQPFQPGKKENGKQSPQRDNTQRNP
jgi:hypothetical protein